jgi:predicted kinase
VTVTPFLVLVTGHAAAGKTTVAPRLAGELGAIWISRDTIHAKVYSGWEPEHPALTSDHYDPEIGANTYFEGKVVWDVFLWMLTTVAPHHPVVADTPFNHPWNREMFGEASATWDFPVVEVALHGDPAALLDRARQRASQPGVHEIKARFSVRPERYDQPYRPVLDVSRVVEVNTTHLDDVDLAEVTAAVRALLGHRAPHREAR